VKFRVIPNSLKYMDFWQFDATCSTHGIPLWWVPRGSQEDRQMNAMKLTKHQIDAQEPSAKDLYLWDTSPPGFGVRVRPTGVKTFIYSYRASGGRSSRKVRHTIGRYGKITLEQARNQAQQLAGQVAAGRDPSAERVAQRLEEARERQTIAVVADEFIERYAKPRNRSWAEYQRILNYNVKPRIGNRPIHELTRRDVVGLLDHVADNSGEVMADHVLAIVRKLCNWHAARDSEFQSPVVIGMARTRPRDLARDRILTDDEIRAIWKALDSATYPFAPLVKLMFLTAQRRQEVAEARWDELQHSTWIIPAERYKTRRPNVVPLPEAASAIVAGLPQLADLLFTTSGTTPFSGFSKAKAHLDEASGVSNWRLHDIRRTARTLMVRIGIRPDIAERVLGHVISGVAGVYDRYDYLDEKRNALEALAYEIESITSGQSRSNVVRLISRG
jgi:integrase